MGWGTVHDLFLMPHSYGGESCLIHIPGGGTDKIRTSAHKGDKRGEKQCWGVEWGEVQFRWTKELAEREVDGKATGVRYVAEEKGRLGLTEQGKLETVKGGRWSGI